MTTRADIIKIADKEQAYSLIDEQEWDSRKKAAARYAWKQKHDPDTIERCPAKGERSGAAKFKLKSINDQISCFATKEERMKKCEEIYNAKIQRKKELKEKLTKLTEEYNKLKIEINDLQEKYKSISEEAEPKECPICMEIDKEYGEESDICQHWNEVCESCREKNNECPYCKTEWFDEEEES